MPRRGVDSIISSPTLIPAEDETATGTPSLVFVVPLPLVAERSRDRRLHCEVPRRHLPATPFACILFTPACRVCVPITLPPSP